jgi:toxin CcdB
MIVTQFMSAFAVSELSDAKGNLSKHHDDVVAALDMLFQRF